MLTQVILVFIQLTIICCLITLSEKKNWKLRLTTYWKINILSSPGRRLPLFCQSCFISRSCCFEVTFEKSSFRFRQLKNKWFQQHFLKPVHFAHKQSDKTSSLSLTLMISHMRFFYLLIMLERSFHKSCLFSLTEFCSLLDSNSLFCLPSIFMEIWSNSSWFIGRQQQLLEEIVNHAKCKNEP